MRYRAALIGCGRIGATLAENPLAPGDVRTHAAAYVACPDTELVAVCDTDVDRLAHCAERYAITRRYSDAELMLREVRPEIVSICTPDQTHVPLANLALSVPGLRAILLEKPISDDLDAAKGLVRAADSAGVLLVINYSRRFAPVWREITRHVQDGGIGAPEHIAGRYSNGLLRNGSHWLDMARAIMGEVREVRASDHSRHVQSDPTLDVDLIFDSGARAHLAGRDGLFSLFEMDLLGDSGRVRMTEPADYAEFFAVAESPRFTGYRELVQTDRSHVGGMRDLALLAVVDLVACLQRGRVPLCTGQDGLAALAVTLAARASARDGRWHRLPGPE